MQARVLLLLGLLILPAGCKLELPAVDTGTIERHAIFDGRDRASTGGLSESQVKALMDWLRAHPTGWEYRIEDTAPGLVVYLKHRGTPVLVVNIQERELKVKDLFRAITPTDRAELLALLEPAKSP